MSDQYVGEIRWFPYVRGAPNGWQRCDGSLLSIAQYETLYTLLGTIYGGNGVATFAVPDLRGRVALHQGAQVPLTPRVIGERAGQESVTLLSGQLGGHSHLLQASTNAATSMAPGGNVVAAVGGGDFLYMTVTGSATPLPLPGCVGLAGNNIAHENCAPTLALFACIATVGVYPSQS